MSKRNNLSAPLFYAELVITCFIDSVSEVYSTVRMLGVGGLQNGRFH